MKRTWMFLVVWAGVGTVWAGQSAYPIGAIGGRAVAEPGKAGLVVRDLTRGAPGMLAGLRAGDEIVSVDGRPFEPMATEPHIRSGPLEALGAAIDRAEGGNGELKLGVKREGRVITVTVRLMTRGAYGKTYPYGCRKSQDFYEDVCVYLSGHLRRSTEQGVQRFGPNVQNAMVCLALLGHQSGRYDAQLGPVADAWAEHWTPDWLEQETGLMSWAIYYSGIFLCEYYLHHPRPKIAEAIGRIGAEMVRRTHPTGRHGHDVEVGYGGAGINAISTGFLWFWATAARCGADIAPFRDAWLRTWEHVRNCTGRDGYVAYVVNGVGRDESLRNGQTMLALYHAPFTPELMKDDAVYQEYRRRVITHISDLYPGVLLEAHAVSTMGILTSLGGLAAHDREGAYRRVMDQWKWWFALSWEPDPTGRRLSGSGSGSSGGGGLAGYVGGKNNVGGDYYLNGHRDLDVLENDSPPMNAAVGIILASSHERLSFYGGMPAIPGVNRNLISRRLDAAYQMIRARRDPQAVRELNGILQSDRDPRESADARKMMEYLDQRTLIPAFTEIRARMEAGDLYRASQLLKAFERDFRQVGDYADRLSEVRRLLETDEARKLIATGARYEAMERQAAQRPVAFEEKVRAFAEAEAGNYYGRQAQGLLEKLLAAATDEERLREAFRRQQAERLRTGS